MQAISLIDNHPTSNMAGRLYALTDRGQVRPDNEDAVFAGEGGRILIVADGMGGHRGGKLASALAVEAILAMLSGKGWQSRNGEHLTQHPILAAYPDNFAARALLNELAVQRGGLLVSGGTSATGGSCLLYEAGHTACLGCQLRIDQLAQQEAQPQPCAQEDQASIVTSNALIGALMAWLLCERLSTGRAEAGMWEYDGRPQHTRLSRHAGWPACRCHREHKKKNR